MDEKARSRRQSSLPTFVVKKPRGTRHDRKRKAQRAGRSGEAEGKLSSLQIKLITLIPGAFGLLAAIVINWELLFPIPPENLVEMAWTHRCRCVDGWVKLLRADGYVVRHFELNDLDGTRRRWNLPADYRGCHPAKYLGYVLDGHVPPDLLRRLADERPEAFGLMQISNRVDHRAHGSRVEVPRFGVGQS